MADETDNLAPAGTAPLPSQDYLRKRFNYDPETGALTWRRYGERGKSWNSKYAGKPALSNVVNGYLRGKLDGRAYSAHRIIWKMLHGEDPDNIDHVNADRGDNRASNLRSVTHQENCASRKRTVQFSGVTWSREKRRWIAKINRNKKRIGLGHFECWGAAMRARIEAEQNLAHAAE